MSALIDSRPGALRGFDDSIWRTVIPGREPAEGGRRPPRKGVVCACGLGSACGSDLREALSVKIAHRALMSARATSTQPVTV